MIDFLLRPVLLSLCPVGCLSLAFLKYVLAHIMALWTPPALCKYKYTTESEKKYIKVSWKSGHF